VILDPSRAQCEIHTRGNPLICWLRDGLAVFPAWGINGYIALVLTRARCGLLRVVTPGFGGCLLHSVRGIMVPYSQKLSGFDHPLLARCPVCLMFNQSSSVGKWNVYEVLLRDICHERPRMVWINFGQLVGMSEVDDVGPAGCLASVILGASMALITDRFLRGVWHIDKSTRPKKRT